MTTGSSSLASVPTANRMRKGNFRLAASIRSEISATFTSDRTRPAPIYKAEDLLYFPLATVYLRHIPDEQTLL
jgi:hypothetical protein